MKCQESSSQPGREQKIAKVSLLAVTLLYLPLSAECLWGLLQVSL